LNFKCYGDILKICHEFSRAIILKFIFSFTKEVDVKWKKNVEGLHRWGECRATICERTKRAMRII